ncbi:MAG: hypothetical protein ACKOPM_17130 [Novosphingobium sp.]
MKIIKLLVSTAMVATSLSPLAVSPAYADTIPEPTAAAASAVTLAAMQTQCTALALAHDIDGIGTGDRWTGEVVLGDVTKVSGPTEVTGTRVIDTSTIVGTGVFTPGTTYIQGAPFRIGGSVNLFGDQYSSAGRWSDSTYHYAADFTSTFAHAFSCDIVQEVYHPAVVHPYYEGKYVVNGDFGGSEDAVRADCEAFSQKGPPATPIPTVDWWGQDHGGNDNNGNVFHCVFQGTAPHTDPAYYDPPEVVGNEAGIPVNQDQTDHFEAIEDHGGPVNANGGPFHIGQVVICISPSNTGPKGVPGTWRAQNGYSGGSFVGPAPGCNTPYFKIAPWGAGTEGSNGTYISVPNYSF